MLGRGAGTGVAAGACLPPAIAAGSLVAVGAAYCQAHALLVGAPAVPVGFSLLWSAATMLPWAAAAVAFERGVARRAGPARAVGAALALGGLAVAAAAALAAWLGSDLRTELYQRAPALLAVLPYALARARRDASADEPGPARDRAGGEALPCAPGDILLAAAAGNYVELRLRGRTLLWRQTMRDAERRLGPGFVRVHRSYLVPRSRVAAVRAGAVELEGGDRVPVSRRYRAGAEALR